MDLPFVTAICPTFGRYPDYAHLVERAVGSFVAQDYPGPRELIILSDCPGQVLVTEVPGVRVVNLSSQVKSLGEKYNLMLEMARGSIVFPWEDDDVSLPHRISQGVLRIAGAEGTYPFDYFNPRFTWFKDGDRPLSSDHSQGVNHNGSCYLRDALSYPNASGAQDQAADRLARETLRCAPPLDRTDLESWSYVYCWGVSPWHLSGHRDTDGAYRAAPRGKPGAYEVFARIPDEVYREVRGRVSS